VSYVLLSAGSNPAIAFLTNAALWARPVPVDGSDADP